MIQKLVVAVAQIETVLGDIPANLGVHLEMVEAARRAGVDLLLFPELSLVGHAAGTQALELARSRHAPEITEIARASGPMTTAFGFIEEAIAAQFHNSVAVVREGELVFLHRKINLATYGKLEEGKHYASGRFVETFDAAPGWRANVLICADTWNPALVHIAAVHGTTLMMAPISSAFESVGADFDNPGGWEINLRFYALTYGMPVMMANRVGREGELTFWGGSRILDPRGRTLAAAKSAGAELLTAELDYEVVRRARYTLPTVRDSNLALLDREIRRLSAVVGVPDMVRKP